MTDAVVRTDAGEPPLCVQCGVPEVTPRAGSPTSLPTGVGSSNCSPQRSRQVESRRGCISPQVLCNKSPQNVAAPNNEHVLRHVSCGSAAASWLRWLLCSVSPQSVSPAIVQSCGFPQRLNQRGGFRAHPCSWGQGRGRGRGVGLGGAWAGQGRGRGRADSCFLTCPSREAARDLVRQQGLKVAGCDGDRGAAVTAEARGGVVYNAGVLVALQSTLPAAGRAEEVKCTKRHQGDSARRTPCAPGCGCPRSPCRGFR